MNKTSIAWTERTFNPVTGCTKYSAGCVHCYAETLTRRFPKAFPNGFDVTLHPERLDEPKHVKKPSMFFVCSMADLFHKDVPSEYIDRVMQTIRDCPQHTFQILTKRTIRMRNYFLTRFVPRNESALINRPGVGRKGLWESNPWVVVYEFKLVK